MSVLADWEIRDLAVEKDMISPFVDHLESGTSCYLHMVIAWVWLKSGLNYLEM
jgi:hypothetical protein